ncbi:MAG: right-handed parallel beta-helix repeat-containing protein [Acidimicrobiales bacterium]|nr:right-handed parallel beta-helix repeat-containing protein [Acidimicrobiales bacterium]MCB9395364.1 right-handed parallel beta-helix repeat-containing protein [Acidimicrobiaceae bacterium]
MSTSLHRAAAALLAAALVAVTACSSDDGASDAAPEPVATVAETAADDTTADTDAATTVPAATDTTTNATDATDAAADTTTADGAGADGIIEVPGEVATIQGAVDVAAPGDLVLIAPGTYTEAVDVTTDEIVIRGLDRNEVILDGANELDNAIRVVGANGVAVENLTTTNYTKNGVFFTGVTGYRASYITTYRTGDYGIYAFDSVQGQIDHSYTSGSPDAGVYIGQCYPCDAVIDQIVSEYNGLGYSGTNSGGNLLIVNSTFRNNRAGIVPNSGSYELCYPERETTIVGNLVYSNNQPDTPAIDVAILAMGNGILSAGGIRNTIERNLVFDHDKTGIGLVPFLEEDPNDDLPTEDEWDVDCETQKQQPVSDPGGGLLWDSLENRVVGNEVRDSRAADLAVASAGGDISTFRNCFSGNVFTTTAPADLETLAPCDADVAATGWDVGVINVAEWLVEAETRPPSVPYDEAPTPEPEPQENMPDAATAPASPATNVPASIDLDAITVPTAP